MKFSRFLFLMGCLGVTGCSSSDADFLRERLFIPKKNKVAQETLAHMVLWPSDKDQPPLEESYKLHQFVQSLPRESTKILIEGGPMTSPKNKTRQHKKAEKIADYLKQQGFLSENVQIIPLEAPHQPGNEPGSEILVAVENYRVIPPSCPDWSYGLGKGFQSIPYSNFGCSNETALAHMVVNPKDLIKGRGEIGQQGIIAQAAMKRYLEDKVKQPETLSTTGTSSSGGSSSSGSSSS